MVEWLLIALGALVAGLILVLLAFFFGLRARSPVVRRAVTLFADRTTARIVGPLFIVGTVTGFDQPMVIEGA